MPSTQLQSVTSAVLEAAGLQEITDADASQRALILRAIKAGIQELASLAPASWWGADEFGGILPGPVSDTVTVTSGSKDITGLDSATYSGQIIKIDGDSDMANRVRTFQGSRQLLYPYGGTTGEKGATILFDTMELPADFRRFKGGLFILGGGPIQVITTDSIQEGVRTPPTGTPSRARVLSREGSDGSRSPFLRFDALTPSSIRIGGEYYCRPQDPSTLDDERNDLCPEGYLESILIPFVMSSYGRLGGSIDANATSESKSIAVRILDSLNDAEGYIPRPTASGIFE